MEKPKTAREVIFTYWKVAIVIFLYISGIVILSNNLHKTRHITLTRHLFTVLLLTQLFCLNSLNSPFCYSLILHGFLSMWVPKFPAQSFIHEGPIIPSTIFWDGQMRLLLFTTKNACWIHPSIFQPKLRHKIVVRIKWDATIGSFLDTNVINKHAPPPWDLYKRKSLLLVWGSRPVGITAQPNYSKQQHKLTLHRRMLVRSIINIKDMPCFWIYLCHGKRYGIFKLLGGIDKELENCQGKSCKTGLIFATAC